MYLFKKNTFNLIKIKINFLLILSSLFFFTNTYGNEKFVGFIDSLQGEAFTTNGEETVKLNEFDQIFINQKIIVGSNSSVTISFVDNSFLTLDSNAEFVVEKFEDTSEEPTF